MFDHIENYVESDVMADRNANPTIDLIYKTVADWISAENEKAQKKGTEIEKGWVKKMLTFNLLGLAVEEKASRNMLTEFFEATPVCFIPNRVLLLASHLTEKYGISHIQLLNKRLIFALVNVYGMKKEAAEKIVKDFPCLWLIHIAQGSTVSSI